MFKPIMFHNHMYNIFIKDLHNLEIKLYRFKWCILTPSSPYKSQEDAAEWVT